MNPKAYIELFHLIFLRQFAAQMDANLYAVKGGCNLRFFFDSIRYSEDLDLDVCTIQTQTLKNKINKILTSPALIKSLQGYGITQIDMTAPKQTQTTQRWKIQLYSKDTEIPYHTKIECSRRHEFIQTKLENVSLKICQTYRLSPIRLPHYDLKKAIEQKILALAHRSFTQARDIFDLYFLLHKGDVPAKLSDLKDDVLEKAEEALLSIHFNDYKSQVVNFLEPEEQQMYDDERYWLTISNEVFHYLHQLAA